MTATTPTAAGGAARHGRLWDRHARDWDENERQQLPTYEAAIRRVGVTPGDRVLDIGSGTGVFLRAVAERGARPFGIDASDGLIAIARERVPDADLRAGDMQFLPWEDDCFDLVTGFNSFFFAADMVAALREARRVAKPGAPVVIQVWGPPERCGLTAMKQALGRFRRVTNPDAPLPPVLWKAGELERIATEAGLTPDASFDTSWAYEYADEETLARAMLAPGPVAGLAEAVGRDPLGAAIVEALAPYRTPDGRYRIENEWHFLVARA